MVRHGRFARFAIAMLLALLGSGSSLALRDAAAAAEAPAACTYSIAPTSVTVPWTAGTGSVAVTTQPGCAWTAAPNSDIFDPHFLTITSGASGSGSGTVDYSFPQNNSGHGRSSILSIAGLSFTVHQEDICTYTLTPPSVAAGPPGSDHSPSRPRRTVGEPPPLILDHFPDRLLTVSR